MNDMHENVERIMLSAEQIETRVKEVAAQLDKLYEEPYLIKTPIVRNGKQATVGYCPEVWKTWE